MKILESKLAELFDKLRIGSPVAYLFIIVFVFGGSAALENFGNLSEELPWLFNGIVDTIIQTAAAALLSSRTKRHMDVTDDDGDLIHVMNIDHDD